MGFMEGAFFPPYITLAHMFHAPNGWFIRDRMLKQFALKYVVDGMAEYPVDGRHYLTRKGDLLFHRPYELYSIMTVPGQPYVCISLVFHFGDTAFPAEELMDGGHLLGNFQGHALEVKLARLVALYRQPGLPNRMRCQSLLLDILAEAAELRKQTSDEERAPAMRNNTRMVLVKNYIIEHFREQLRHEQLERIAGLTRNHIIAEFRQTYGITPMQYVIQMRMDKAKELALQTNLTISEIAAKVGYADVHTFGRMFRKKMGMSLSSFCASLIT